MPLELLAPPGGDPFGILEWSTLVSSRPREVTEVILCINPPEHIWFSGSLECL